MGNEKKFKVLVTGIAYKIPPWRDKLEILRDIAEVRLNPHERLYTKEELLDEVRDVDGLIVHGDVIDEDILDAGKKLKAICCVGGGNPPHGINDATVEAAWRRNVILTYTPGATTNGVADFTFALILACVRKLVQIDAFVKSSKWTRWHVVENLQFLSHDLSALTLGIIGLGGIGYAVAERARGFGMKILCYVSHADPKKAEKVGARLVDLDTLCRASDVITIHVPLTEETRGLIGERELGLMKSSAYLVNTARGAVLDEKALYAALRERRIAGAGLDVHVNEPMKPDDPLIELDNVILTSRSAGATFENYDKAMTVPVEEMCRILKGEAPKYRAPSRR